MRQLHKLYAFILGYFWIPCSNCNKMFGGHEWRDRKGRQSSIPTETNQISMSGTAICPACTESGVGDRAWADSRWHRVTN